MRYCQALYQRTGRLLIAFAFPFSASVIVLLPAPAEAGNCTVEKPVPWNLTFEQPKGAGMNISSPLSVYNDLGPGKELADIANLKGKINIGVNHNPAGACFGPIDPLPDKDKIEADVLIDWLLTGTYINTTYTTNPAGADFETYVKVYADGLTFVPNDPPLAFESLTGISGGNIKKSRPAAIKLGLGDHFYVGSVNVATRYGGGLSFPDGLANILDVNYIRVTPFLELRAELADPQNRQIRYLYPEPVPAPLPLLGVGAFFSAARKLRRKNTQMKSISII
jgi:hypothetical protein